MVILAKDKEIQFFLFLIIGLAVVLTTASEKPNLKVNVYDGPTVCTEAEKVKAVDQIGIHYTGTIDESSNAGVPGAKFDSSRDRNIVLDVTIGVGDLIEGWDIGLLGLCSGAKAILVVPPEMAYGDHGVGDIIPGGATLRFDVEIVSVTSPPLPPNLFDELDVDKDNVLTPAEIHAHFKKEGPDAEMPPDLMEREDANKDGVVSRDEFGGPRIPWEMCLELLHRNSGPPTTQALAVQWICYRPHNVDNGEMNQKDNDEL